jgi:diguanylate cyclase
MRYQIDKDTVMAVAKKALLAMSQREITLYPENYWVWFDYNIGANKELESDINRIIQEGGCFSDEINDGIYLKHFGSSEPGLKAVEDAQKEIRKILKDVLDEILHTQNFTSDYRDKLNGFTTELKEAKDLEEIHRIVSNLMRVTVEVIQASEQLKEHLTETTSKSENLQKELEKAQHEILIDPLTALFNRKAFDRKISAYMTAFQESGNDFALVLIDIDFFKRFNDQYGHLLGDQVLKFMGTLLSKEMKGKDFVARYGGEEFIILMEGTSLENAVIVADKIRKSLEGVQLKYVKTGQTLGKISISAGVSVIREDDTVESLLKRADDALYLAKQSGRNNIKSELDLPCGKNLKEIVPPSMVAFLK